MDVARSFDQVTWIGTNEPVQAFVCIANNRVITADVAWLLIHL